MLWLFSGEPPQTKPHALHTCNNPQCVNPAHLYWGDNVENRKDLERDDPASQSFKAQFKKGHTQFWNGNRVLQTSHVEYIKKLLEAGYTRNEIARWYGVSKTVIKGIHLGHTYKYVEPYRVTDCGVYVEKPDPSFGGKRKLSNRQILEIRSRYASGEKKSDIAKVYNVCQPTIHKIVNSKRWVTVVEDMVS